MKFFLKVFCTLFCSASLFGGFQVNSSLTLEDVVSPGDITKGSIPLKNTGDTPIRVEISLCDYSFNSVGESFYDSPGTLKRSSCSWVTMNPNSDSIDIPAHTTVNLLYDIKIPNDKTMHGTYWSMLILCPTEINPSSPDTSDGNNITMSVRSRYGIQLISHIGQSGKADLKITNKEVITFNEQKFMNISVENNGNRLIAPKLQLELFNQKGTKVLSEEQSRIKIYPGCSVAYRVPLEEVSPDEYQGLIVLDGGDDQLFGSNTRISIPKDLEHDQP